MTLSRSVRRKMLVTGLAAVGFSLLYEARTFDSYSAAQQQAKAQETAEPALGRTLRFWATAYCKGETTASGVAARRGIAASDPALLPVGSVIKIDARDPKYSGIYTIMDTGPAVKGRKVDLYMWSCYEALAFGRRRVDLTVLRLGWSPHASTPSVIDTLFQQREEAQKAAPPPDPPSSPDTPRPSHDDSEAQAPLPAPGATSGQEKGGDPLSVPHGRDR